MGPLLGCPGHLWVRHRAGYLKCTTASALSSIHGSSRLGAMMVVPGAACGTPIPNIVVLAVRDVIPSRGSCCLQLGVVTVQWGLVWCGVV